MTVIERINQLRTFNDGWLRGYGKAPSQEGLNWFEAVYREYFPKEILEPAVNPTIFGGIQLEWAFGDINVSMAISFKSRIGHWRQSDFITNTSHQTDFDLANPNAWKTIAGRIQKLSEENA
jgi:hypothetical protein